MVLPSFLGCDSLVITNYILIEKPTTFLTNIICDPSQVGKDTLILKANSGCDSLIIINKEVREQAITITNSLTCDPIAVTTTTQTLTNQHGCDSLIQHHVQLAPPEACRIDFSVRTDTICPNSTDGHLFIQVALGTFPIEYLVLFKQDTLLTGTINSIEEQINLLNLAEGEYDILLQNDLGISITEKVELPSYPTLQIASEISNFNGYAVSCAEAEDGYITIQPQNNLTDLRFRWSNGSTNSILEKIGEGNYHLDIFDSHFCRHPYDFLLTAPPPLTVDLEVESPLCFEDEMGQVTINNFDHEFGTVSYSLDGILYEPVVSTPLTIALPPNDYALSFQDENGCDLTTAFDILPSQENKIDLGADRTIELGESILIQPNANFDIERLEWSANAPDFSCYKCDIVDYQPIQSDTYFVKAYDINNCLVEDDIRIFITKQKQTYLPSAFSPNADGINDYYQPYFGPSVEKVYLFQIGDDRGHLVFQAKNYSPTDTGINWDGRFHGRLLTANHFVAMVEVGLIDGTRERYVQTFNLVR